MEQMTIIVKLKPSIRRKQRIFACHRGKCAKDHQSGPFGPIVHRRVRLFAHLYPRPRYSERRLVALDLTGCVSRILRWEEHAFYW